MTVNKIKHTSFSISIALHVIVFAFFFLVKVTEDAPTTDFVELGFGIGGGTGSAGGYGFRH